MPSATHQAQRATRLADDLARSARCVLDAPTGGVDDTADLARLLRNVAAFADLGSGVDPAPSGASRITGSLVRAVRRRSTRTGEPMAPALLRVSEHLERGVLEAPDRDVLRLLVRLARQSAADSTSRR